MMRPRFVAMIEAERDDDDEGGLRFEDVSGAHLANLGAASWPLMLPGFDSPGATLRARRARATVLA
jgi:hypothetical protein